MPPLTEGNRATIDRVLECYRVAREARDTQAIVDIAASLDGWVRSLLEIVEDQDKANLAWQQCAKSQGGQSEPPAG